MKTKLLFTILFFTFITLNSQNIWTGNVDDLWSNADNWSGNVPDSSEDVLIPSGFVVTLDTPANILSLEVQGNSTLNVTQGLTIQNPSEFGDNVVVNWSSGDLIGPGVLTNYGIINLSFSSFDLAGSVVLNNPGEINLSNGATIIIGTQSVLNNSGTGIIDFQSDGVEITSSGALPNVLNNYGTIKTSFSSPSDMGSLSGQFINTDGIFQIDNGTLNLTSTQINLTGGQYNIASNATLNWIGPIEASGVFSGIVNGELNWSGDVTIQTTATFGFSGNSIINSIGGELNGGGTLINNSIISCGSAGLVITDGSTLDNNGEINLNSTSDLLIGSNSTLNNNVSGMINLNNSMGDILSQGIADASRVLNNYGTLVVDLPDVSDTVSIGVKLNNINGYLQVSNGALNLINSAIELSDGVYNVSSTGLLNWSQPITISGILTGNLDGELNWNSTLFISGNANLNFSGSGFIDWVSGNLDGGGTLTNNNLIVKSSGGTKRINNGTTLNNNGEIRQIVGGNISITTNSTLNNNANGLINLQASTSGFNAIGVAPNLLNNYGTIHSNPPSGTTNIGVQVINSGFINVIQNSLSFTGTIDNTISGVMGGVGTINLPGNSSNLTNGGTVAPGLSPGTLFMVNDYKSSSTSNLQIELNGLNQGVDYDLLSINGDADLEGNLEIILGFSPSVNDEFVVLITQGANIINTCNLPASVTATHGGTNYEFDVVCRNNNELVLTVADSTLSESSETVPNAQIYPNPSDNYVYINTTLPIFAIKVYDMFGKLLLSTKHNRFSVKNFPSGIYAIEILSISGNKVTRKIIKN
ncbi:T9SS type A sorting domain-containing protein [Winogradskyella ouciana]|uniref:T9SS type A sorting domain-containing protein n=1 Tax=Winogradskyella ouciana TaxID=2608631 RepID=A0A7K1GDD7_9FLAO|nr:T9SS type A sorting domain-containing protein [Winogradskyella ouciana]MTE27153.1 T9SS type A sorting domain-containing protein [Winogradskyella ouciana]